MLRTPKLTRRLEEIAARHPDTDVVGAVRREATAAAIRDLAMDRLRRRRGRIDLEDGAEVVARALRRGTPTRHPADA